MNGAGDAEDRIREVISTTEKRVEAIKAEVRDEVERMGGEAEARVRAEAEERLVRVSELRAELIDRASTLASGFEVVLEALDRAERELTTQAGKEPPPRREAPRVDQIDAIRVTLRERHRIAVAEDSVSNGPVAGPLPVPRRRSPAAVPAPRRRRWWRRWLREAA